jgi:hypothetical protein
MYSIIFEDERSLDSEAEHILECLLQLEFFSSLLCYFAYKILVGKPKRNRPLRRSSHRWEDNIKMYLKKIGWQGVDWIHQAQDRDWWLDFVNTVMILWVPQKLGNVLS